jgi:gliding motility-associated lipoprotein GldD
MRSLAIILIFCSALTLSCKENYTPKPHGYLKISVPADHHYLSAPEGLPFTLDYSSYASWEVLKVSQKSRKNTQWYNITYPKYNAKIHLSYIPIFNNLDSLLEESHKFVFEHTVRADAIDETSFHKPEKDMHGVLFDLQGNSASNMEFLATDSTHHFLRGALYFEITPNVDSLSPIIDYIKTDIIYMINSLEWTCQ